MSLTSTDLVSMIETAAEAAVQRSFQNAITPVIRHGVLVDHDAFNSIHKVQMDGDTSSVPCHDVTTGYRIPIGTKVTVLFAPPHQAFIVGMVVPPGPIRQIVVSTNSPSYTAGSAVTELVLDDVPLIGGVTYAFHCHELVEFTSASVEARWTMHFRVNAAQIDRAMDLKPRVTGVSYWIVDSWAYWTPDTTDVYDIDMTVSENVAGADIQLQATTAGAFRHLTVHDAGVLPRF